MTGAEFRQLVQALGLALLVVAVVALAVIGIDELASPRSVWTDAGLVCGPGTHRQAIYAADHDLPDECRPGPVPRGDG